MSLGDLDLDTRTQEILLASSNHDLDALKSFLRVPGAASVQDPETGFTPLHAAIAACSPITEREPYVHNKSADAPINSAINSHSHESQTKDEDEEVDNQKAIATMKELFLSGAIWNDLDMNNETPGCLAWRLGQKELYELVVEAGVRAELLMNLMGGYEQLPDEEKEEEEEEVEEEGEAHEAIESKQGQTENASANDTTPEHALYPLPPQNQDVTSEQYLNSTLTFTPSKLLDSAFNGVMMSWEAPIMNLTAKLFAPSPSLRILNIGFGLGIIDRLFAATSPAAHHIIEAHPDVIARLQSAPEFWEDVESSEGKDNFAFFGPEWLRKGEGKNVIHEGRWQHVVPKLLEDGMLYDAIYFDTFGEDYSQLKIFFTEYVVGLLAPDGQFGFFNGLGADRRVCYDVYSRVVELDLCDAGLDVEWLDVDVDLDAEGCGEPLGKEGEGEWKGVRSRYWKLEKYRLPICRFLG